MPSEVMKTRKRGCMVPDQLIACQLVRLPKSGSSRERTSISASATQISIFFGLKSVTEYLFPKFRLHKSVLQLRSLLGNPVRGKLADFGLAGHQLAVRLFSSSSHAIRVCCWLCCIRLERGSCTVLFIAREQRDCAGDSKDELHKTAGTLGSEPFHFFRKIGQNFGTKRMKLLLHPYRLDISAMSLSLCVFSVIRCY